MIEPSELYTLYDGATGHLWMCQIPQEAIGSVIGHYNDTLRKVSGFKVRKTSNKDIVNQVPRYEDRKNLFDERG